MAHIERPKSLNQLVLDRLRQAIIEGDYGLGQPLSELRIATDFGTSKGPVRRAIVQLQMENLVRVVPQSGTFVFSLDTDELFELNESRLIFEEAALKLAMRRNCQGLASTLEATYSEMVEAWNAHDLRSYLTLDTVFHNAIFLHCENRYLADAYRLVSGRAAAIRTHLASVKPHQMDLSFEEHKQLVEAIKNSNETAALKTLRTHIVRVAKTYQARVGDIATLDLDAKSE